MTDPLPEVNLLDKLEDKIKAHRLEIAHLKVEIARLKEQIEALEYENMGDDL